MDKSTTAWSFDFKTGFSFRRGRRGARWTSEGARRTSALSTKLAFTAKGGVKGRAPADFYWRRGRISLKI
jgi:hypothetical protein